jgi:hypothetical protein
MGLKKIIKSYLIHLKRPEHFAGKLETIPIQAESRITPDCFCLQYKPRFSVASPREAWVLDLIYRENENFFSESSQLTNKKFLLD